MTRRGIVIGALAALAGGLLGATVAAHTTSSPADVSLGGYTSGGVSEALSGTITTVKPACYEGRKVFVYRKKSGDDLKFGADRAQETTAEYTVTAPTGNVPQGTYYSRIRKFDLAHSAAHEHVCEGDRSQNFDAGP
jgi:hypothetical protein